MQSIKITETYKDFYKLIINDEMVEIAHVTSLLHHIATSNRTLYEYGLFLKKEGDFIIFLPGSYDVYGNFYNHPIKISDNLVLVSLKEKDFYGQGAIFGISSEEQKERNNPRGIQIVLHTVVGYEVTPFTIYCNNRFTIFNAVRAIHYLRLYLQEGLKLSELNPDFGAVYSFKLMQRYTEDCYKRIVDFVYGLKFYNNRENGVTILNENKNNYFAHLMDSYTDFKKISENKFSGKNERDHGDIRRSEYRESAMNEVHALEYRNEITVGLAKNYNPSKEIIYHFFKND